MDLLRSNRLPAALAALSLLLGACGGGSSMGLPANVTPPRGTLLATPPQLVSAIPTAALLAQLVALAPPNVLRLGGTPACDIAVYHIRYETVGGANEPTTASAALMVPAGGASPCGGPRPIVLYAHGTTTDRAFNIADLQNSTNVEGLILAAFFASQGYIVVAPNYAGYDTSTLPYHPYLIADQQSKDMIDALTAARAALEITSLLGTSDDGKLYITGYSQGGYVAMATQRAMEAAGMPVTAAAPMSGPYALAAFVDAVFFGEVNASATVSSTLLVTAYQKAYGDMYASPLDVFEAAYATGIETLLPSTTPRAQLYAEGKLPQNALFSSTPPDPTLAVVTPATSPVELAATFAAGFGANNLVTNSYRLTFIDDAQVHPDGGWPAITTGVTAAAPAVPMRQALKNNDLRDWRPGHPVLLCGGDGDPTVFFVNTQLLQAYWVAQAVPATAFAVLDLDSSSTAGDPYASLKSDFVIAKDLVAADAIAQGATDLGASAVAAAYHATLVPPFCFAAMRSFFAAH
jgi:Secretory lipase